MGADGGSIPRREEMVKVKERNEKGIDLKKEQLKSKWHLCSLSNEPLRPPIVTCQLGNLYNKDSVIKYLLSKKMPKSFKHIHSLKVIF